MNPDRRLRLGLTFNHFGFHLASWRHPHVKAQAIADLQHHVDIAQAAERGRFDFLFMADSFSVGYGDEAAGGLGRQPFMGVLEPFSLLSAVSMATRNIGLVASANTTYGAPYHVARTIASLDHISGGRAGWNLVTGGNPADAEQFGDREHPSGPDRYRRAREFAQVVFGLWDSWEDDAFVCDKAGGLYFDPARMRRLDHHGEHFHVRGPLSVPRTPQGRPVTAQAGQSEEGRELAAATADIVFTAATSLENAKAFYDDLKGRMARYGRAPEELLIMPGVLPFVGATLEEAQAKLAAVEANFDLGEALRMLSLEFGADMSVYPLDEPIPDIEAAGWTSRGQMLKAQSRSQNLTLRRMALNYGAFGHWMLIGTPRTIADTFQAWFEAGAVDGFMVEPPYMLGALTDFVEQVAPELQRRGLFRREYEAATLRGNLGLPAPLRGVRSFDGRAAGAEKPRP